MNKLPDKASELIRLAIKDLKIVEQNENYVVDMDYWHAILRSGKCAVCLSGAVISQELDVPLDVNTYPSSFDRDIELKLRSLNQFRQGNIRAGFYDMSVPIDVLDSLPEELRYTTVPEYRDDKEGFYSSMEQMVQLLQAHGY